MTAPNMDTDLKPEASTDAVRWRRFAGLAGEDVKIDPEHRLQLAGAPPARFKQYLTPVIPPDPLRREALMLDRWRIGHERLQLAKDEMPWDQVAPSRHYADRLHRFDWLPDLFDEGEDGAARGRALVDDWCEQFGEFHTFYWRMVPLTARVWNWMLLGAALFDCGDNTICDRRRSVLVRQLRHMSLSLESCQIAGARWRASCGLLSAAITLDGLFDADEQMAVLESECTAQLLPDGGHVSRSPQAVLRCLADLLVLRSLLEDSEHQVPDFFTKWIPRMAAMLNFFRMPDDALAPFNDGGEGRAEAVTAILDAVGTAPRRFSFAMKSGFQKLEKNGLCLILDAGQAPPLPYAGRAHSGTLGFNLADGKARLVTSCGFSPEINLNWQAAVRRTSAHSTLTLGGRDATPFEPFEESRLLCPVGPEGVSAKRLEEGDEIWLDAQHGGWKAKYGLIHRRRLFMSGDGRRLTGEDAIVRPVSQALDEDGKFVSFDIRFHLHPSVSAVTDGDAIRLICKSGPVWRFRTTHPGTRLEVSRYLGRGLIEEVQQIVMSGQADPNGDGSQPPNCIRWGFRRETA